MTSDKVAIRLNLLDRLSARALGIYITLVAVKRWPLVLVLPQQGLLVKGPEVPWAGLPELPHIPFIGRLGRFLDTKVIVPKFARAMPGWAPKGGESSYFPAT